MFRLPEQFFHHSIDCQVPLSDHLFYFYDPESPDS